MSKKISSIVTSIAGVMVVIPTTSDANIATTGYVNKIVNQTHAVGSALQFGILADDASPLFMLGAINQPTAGANGGSLVGSYGAISVEKLALALTPNLMGSAITGFITGSGSHILVGDGTTTGTAGWTSVQNMLLKGLTNNPITGDINNPGAVPYYIAGTERVIWSDDVSDLVRTNRLHYSELPQSNIGSRVLVEYKTDIHHEKNHAGFTTVTDMLINGISDTPPEKVRFAIPTLNTITTRMSWINLEEAIASRGSTIKYYSNLTGSEVGSRLLVERGTDATAGWASLSTIGSKIGGFATGSGSHILVGDGTTSGTAQWSTLFNILMYGGGRMLPEQIYGFTTLGSTMGDVGFASLYEAAEALGSLIGSYASGFATGSGSYVLVGDGTTSGTAGWSSVEDTIRDMFQSDGNVSERYDTYMLQYTRGKNVVNAIPSSRLYSETVRSRRMTAAEIMGFPALAISGNDGWIGIQNAAEALGSFIGSYASGFATGSGSYVLVGDGTTSGTAAWSSVTDIVLNAPYSTVTRDFNNVLVNQEANGIRTNLKMPKTTFGSLISPHIQGSAISGYTTGSGAPTYILGTNTTGAVTGATMKLHAISGLGSEIKFTETKTAAELSASTGTVYFPVIQNGQIYGVTLNDFYILMNAKF